MIVEELYNLMEKKSDEYTYWSFTVYVDGINNNIITIMEKRVMQMTGCNRQTANLVANEVLDYEQNK